MILKSLKLYNIRSYTDEIIEFPKGSVLLSGDIGSGKSTILLAIEFALFGLRRTHLPGQALLRNGKTEGYVELKFSIGGKEISIKRSLKLQKDTINQTSGYIIINGIKTEGTAVELKSKILELLGYPRSEISKSKDLIYRYTVYTPQEQMKEILFEPSDIRLDTLRKVFNIDRYKRIRENSTIISKALKDQSNIYLGKSEDLEKNISEKEILEKNILELKEKLSILSPQKEISKEKIKDFKEKIKLLEEKIQKYILIKNELSNNEESLKDIINQRLENSKNIERILKEIKTLKQKILDTKIEKPNLDKKELDKILTSKEIEFQKNIRKKEELTQKVRHNESVLKDLQKEIFEKTTNSRNLRNKLSEKDTIQKELEDKEDTIKKIKEYEDKISTLKEELQKNSLLIKNSNEIKENISVLRNCPTCYQEVSQNHKKEIVDKENLKILNSKENITGLEKEIYEINKDLKNLNEKKERYNKIEEELLKIRFIEENLKDIDKEMIEKQKRYSLLDLEKIKLEEELEIFNDESLEIEKENIKKLKDELKRFTEYELKIKEKENIENLIKEKESNLKNIENIQENLKKNIGKINIRKIELNKILDENKNLEENLKLYKTELEKAEIKDKELMINSIKLEEEINSKGLMSERLDKEIISKKSAKEKIKKINEYRVWFEDHFIKLMVLIEKHLMSTVYTEFNDLLQKWFNLLIEDENINIRLNEEFSPVVEQNGYEVSIEHLSGGEKTAASLAYRLALNKVINDVQGSIKTKDLIILDEPTDGFSSEQLDKLRDVLEELNINQTIIVSHESKIESFVENIIRINKNEHISKISG